MKGILFVIFLFSCSVSFSQAVINFSEKAHDFGKIKEINGAVSYDFEFVNTGSAPILIKNVESSCGCTSPQWSKQPVLPGKKGFVKATFDPKDRPGFFDKTITVYSNARTPVVELKIKGIVEGRARTVLDDYPYELPSGLRLPQENISLLKVRKGESKTMQIGVFNNSGKEAVVTFQGLPAYMQMKVEPQKIGNRGKGMITATYHTAQQGEFGLNEEEVVMLVNGKKYALPVTIYVEEDLSHTDPAKAPAIDADKKYYNFEKTTSGQPVSFTYRVKNTGNAPMQIHRVYTNDKRVEVEAVKKQLQPGESVPVTVKTKSGAGTGKLTCLISVITNCPVTPEFNLRFYGEIH